MVILVSFESSAIDFFQELAHPVSIAFALASVHLSRQGITVALQQSVNPYPRLNVHVLLVVLVLPSRIAPVL